MSDFLLDWVVPALICIIGGCLSLVLIASTINIVKTLF